MNSRIDEVPKLRTRPATITGQCYNQVRLGLLRLKNPLRIPLPGLRGMDIILDNQAWVCVDRTLYDLPVLAWTDFDLGARGGIHEPVHCLLHHYHIYADLITQTVLSTVTNEIAKRLGAGAGADPAAAAVHDFPDV